MAVADHIRREKGNHRPTPWDEIEIIDTDPVSRPSVVNSIHGYSRGEHKLVELC